MVHSINTFHESIKVIKYIIHILSLIVDFKPEADEGKDDVL